MQTFLPYPDFAKSAAALDPSRLGNQVYREGKTLIQGGWPHHPAAKMWVGHKPALAEYCLACLNELEKRGRRYPHHVEFFTAIRNEGEVVMPEWFGDERVHSSHRAALLFKNPQHYGQFGWSESPAVPNEKGKLPYFWPV